MMGGADYVRWPPVREVMPSEKAEWMSWPQVSPLDRQSDTHAAADAEGGDPAAQVEVFHEVQK